MPPFTLRIPQIRCPNHIGFSSAGTCPACLQWQLREEIRRDLKLNAWVNPHTITLTTKQSLPVTDYDWHQPITDVEASKSLRRLYSMLNRDLLDRCCTRKGKGLGMFVVREYGRDGISADKPLGRLHFHGIIECPDPSKVEGFAELVGHYWRQTHWGYQQTKVEPYKGDEWFFYIMKNRTKSDLLSSIDPEGWRLPTWREPTP